MSNTPLLEVRDLRKTYDEMEVVRGINFTVNEGESVGIVGESGCGKSTTARIIAGLEPPTEGEILFRGEPYRLRPGRGRSRINMVFQDPVASFDGRMTVFESLYEALSHTESISKKDALEPVKRMLKTVELPEVYTDRLVSRLSGGECQRVGIARALLTKPELLICDEATSALDVSVQAQIIHLLHQLKEELNLTYLFISHDLGLVAGMCSRVLVMYQGQLVEQGSVRSVLDNPAKPYTKILRASADAFTIDENGRTSSLPDAVTEQIKNEF